jgi:N-acetylglucosaminyldiphosphoundecaprenol N-acetyl-beta-D-mannosaminyltransferase
MITRDTSRIPRRRVFGLDFVDLDSLDTLVDELASLSPIAHPNHHLPIVMTPNVDHLVKLDRRIDATSAALVCRAAYVLPDGQPIVWASRWLGTPLRARLPGSSLVQMLWPRLMADDRVVLVVASSQEIADRVMADGRHAHAVVAPQISLVDRAALDHLVDECAALCRELGVSHLFVTLGFPKQCNVIDGVVSRLTEAGLPVPVCLAVGASFEMHYGLVRRAPEWMQRGGLEWFYRFLQEPHRLFRRYFVEDPAFVRLVAQEFTSLRDRAVEC